TCVGIGERTEPIELVDPIKDPEEAADRYGNCCVFTVSTPKRATTHLLEPQHQEDEEGARQQVHSSRDAGEQVQPECSDADEQRAPASGLEPFVLKRETCQCEQT